MRDILRHGLHLGLGPRLAVAFVLIFSSAGGAATFSVSNLADAGPGSLRQAVLDANAAAGSDEIVFAAGLNGTITLTLGEMKITDDLVVHGPGADVITVSGNNLSRIFNIDDGSATELIDVTLSGLTLTRGHAVGTGGAISATENLQILFSHISDSTTTPGGCGGNISVSGPGDSSPTLLLEDSTVTRGLVPTFFSGSAGGNICAGGELIVRRSEISDGRADRGGGIFISEAHLTIESSTISGNRLWEESADGGGGIHSVFNNVEIVNSTISGNTAVAYGGGIYFDPGIAAGGPSTLILQLRLTTLVNNTAADDSNLSVAFGFAENTLLDHSIIANGGAHSVSAVNATYSLIEDIPPFLIHGSHNIIGVDPLLGPLANNGGPTRTHALLPGSPAIDAGNPAIPKPPPTDQRGFPRIVGAAVDLGAVEQQQSAAEVPTLSQLGGVLLCGLLCAAGVWRLRKVRAQA